MANYRSFLTGLAGTAAQGIKERRDEERDLAKTMSSLIMKAQIEQQMKDPLEQEYKRAQIDKMKREQEQPQKWEPTDEESAIRFFQKTRGAAKGGQQVIGEDEQGNPVYAPTNEKPLAADASNKYSGSIQGLANIGAIEDTLGSMDEKSARELILKANKAVNAASAKDTIIPWGKGIYQRNLASQAGDEGLSLANYFMTLAENTLRARSGAAVTPSEEVREQARSLLNSFYESPGTWKQKLQNNRIFLEGTAKEIRPSAYVQDFESAYKSLSNARKSPKGNKREIAGFTIEEIPE